MNLIKNFLIIFGVVSICNGLSYGSEPDIFDAKVEDEEDEIDKLLSLIKVTMKKAYLEECMKTESFLVCISRLTPSDDDLMAAFLSVWAEHEGETHTSTNITELNVDKVSFISNIAVKNILSADKNILLKTSPESSKEPVIFTKPVSSSILSGLSYSAAPDALDEDELNQKNLVTLETELSKEHILYDVFSNQTMEQKKQELKKIVTRLRKILYDAKELKGDTNLALLERYLLENGNPSISYENLLSINLENKKNDFDLLVKLATDRLNLIKK